MQNRKIRLKLNWVLKDGRRRLEDDNETRKMSHNASIVNYTQDCGRDRAEIEQSEQTQILRSVPTRVLTSCFHFPLWRSFIIPIVSMRVSAVNDAEAGRLADAVGNF